MDNVLVIGVETVAGANLAAHLAERHRVEGLCWSGGVTIEGCRTLASRSAAEAVDYVRLSRPDFLIYCGPESVSAWDHRAEHWLLDNRRDRAVDWARAAVSAGSRFAMVSSSAVFSGPWMFHEEDSTAFCSSRPAEAVRKSESDVLAACPTALILRSNVFGWSPVSEGWIEGLLGEIESDRILRQDAFRHDTPILATDLADIIERSLAERLEGVFHVGGAERVSPLRFAQRLADQFDLPWLSLRREEPLNATPNGYGKGECSLQTKKLRKTLCVAMPLLTEGLERLAAQQFNGSKDRLVQPTRRFAFEAA